MAETRGARVDCERAETRGKKKKLWRGPKRAKFPRNNFGNKQNKECFFNSGRVAQIQEKKASRSFEVYIITSSVYFFISIIEHVVSLTMIVMTMMEFLITLHTWSDSHIFLKIESRSKTMS